ncbi:galactokinase [Irineochytrium annulatum]|nr:galactokinase [Irineochytrium annulatum]
MALNEGAPPSVTSLDRIYASEILKSTQDRYADLRKKFVARFNKEPEFFARSPGRVNIIGEHIDYCGFSVLPMAITRDVVIAVASGSDDKPTVTVVNSNGTKYKENTFIHDEKNFVDIDSSVLEWSNYFKCGYKGAFEELGLPSKGKSLLVLIDGNVPAGAGVSSSSAFVCASALATTAAFGKEATKGALAQTAIRAERYCGVHSGGMDQSISIMGQTGSALMIHFVPKLYAEPIHFPAAEKALVFVIANTLVTADKHTTAPTNYNLRVVETRLAAAMLALHLKLEHSATLREVKDRWVKAQNGDDTGKEADTLAKMEGFVDAAFKDGKYSKEEVATFLGTTVAEIDSKYVGNIVIRCDGFEIKKRARHVLSEAKRVYQFRDVCSKKPPFTGDLITVRIILRTLQAKKLNHVLA